MKVRFGCESIERKKCIELFLREMLEFILPNCYKYLIWSAHENQSIFAPNFEKAKLKKNNKYLLYEQKLKNQ